MADGVSVRFVEGDAEDLPFEDASFDLVVSLIGAMFAPRPERVVAELTRVCRPGGRIVMANWTPLGHIGQMFKIIGNYVPPSPVMASPVQWGDARIVRDRFQNGIARLDITNRWYPMRYPFPPAEVVEFFRKYYGPANRAFAVLDADRQRALRRDLEEELWNVNNRVCDSSTLIDAEYLEVSAIRL